MSKFKPFYSIYYVDKDKKPIPGKVKTYGLKYLRADYCAFMNKGIELYENSFYGGINFSGVRIATHRQLIKESIAINDHVGLRAKMQLLHSDIKEEKLFRVYMGVHVLLKTNESWDRWYDELKDEQKKARLSFFRTKWKLQSRFFPYTSKGLVFAMDILMELEWHLNAAKSEFKKIKKRLPEPYLTNYGNYLKDFFQCIESEKKALIEAMYARLSLACGYADLTYDDVTFELLHNLKKLGVQLELKNEFQKSRDSLDTEIIGAFLKFINTRGDELINKKIALLDWFNEAGNFPLVFIQNSTENYFIPRSLKHFIPIEAKKPKWIFKGHYKRFIFFKNKKEFLLTLSILSNLDLKVKNLNHPSEDFSWKIIKKLQSDILLNIKMSQAYLIEKGLGYFFRGKTNQFFSEFEKELYKQQKILLNKKLDFVEQFIPKIQPINPIIGEPLFSEGAIQDINNFLRELEEDISIVPCTEDTKRRFFNIQKEINKLIDQDLKILEQKKLGLEVEKSLYILSQGEIIKNENYKNIFSYYRSLPSNFQIRFIYTNEKFIAEIINKLQIIIQNYHFKTDDNLAIFENFELACMYACLLREFDYMNKNQNFKTAASAFLKQYISYIKNCSVEKIKNNREGISKIEYLLENILSEELLKDFYLIKFQSESKCQNVIIKDPELVFLIKESEIKLEESKKNRVTFFDAKWNLSDKKIIYFHHKEDNLDIRSQHLLEEFKKLNSRKDARKEFLSPT